MRLWKTAKRTARRTLRFFNDLQSGDWQRFARKRRLKEAADGWFESALEQPIRPGPTLQQKLKNIQLACTAIDGLVLAPGEIFSFWQLVGAPVSKRGFLASRNIVRGKLSLEVGGGLCQVSGIIYHLGLMSGLSILERHAHSADIYREEERFSPLGADATVVFGYKDLRIQNPYAFPLVFRFVCTSGQLRFSIFTPEPIRSRDIIFMRERVGERERVETRERMEAQTERRLALSWYELSKNIDSNAGA